jgi:CDP-diacylglycerol--serine O-phosphatidyltransferase
LEPATPNLKFNKKGGMRRGVYILPSLFTVGTLVCGYYAILAALRGSVAMTAGGGEGLSAVAFDNAARAIGWAILFDGLDGRIARLTNATSAFGRELDSLADVIAFGVAPAVLAYAWGIRAISEMFGPPLIEHLRQAGWIVTFAYVICGAARLGRFNIESVKPTADRRYFVGMPIPAAAGTIAAIVHWEKTPLNHWVYSLVWMGVVAILAFLMVSRMRYYSFKTLDLRRRRSYIAIIFLGLIIWAIWVYSEPVLLIIALTYALSGIILRITSKFRPHPPAPQEVHAA